MSATTVAPPCLSILTRVPGIAPGGGGGASGPTPPTTAYRFPSPWLATSTAPEIVASVWTFPLRISSTAPVVLSTTINRLPGPMSIPRGFARFEATIVALPAEAATKPATSANSTVAPTTRSRRRIRRAIVIILSTPLLPHAWPQARALPAETRTAARPLSRRRTLHAPALPSTTPQPRPGGRRIPHCRQSSATRQRAPRRCPDRPGIAGKRSSGRRCVSTRAGRCPKTRDPSR